MDPLLQDQRFYRNSAPKHKMTTDVQYNLLKIHMNMLSKKEKIYSDGSEASKYKKNYVFWTDLTEKLNTYGPPYRTIQQWKKVWCDFRRAQRKRGVDYKPKIPQYIKQEPISDNTSQTEVAKEEIPEAAATSDELEVSIKTEKTDCEQSSQSIYTSYSNEYGNDYSYPDEDDSLQDDSHLDDNETFIPPDESSSGSHSYASQHFNKTMPGGYIDDHQPESKTYFTSPPPLQPSRLPMLNQTLYTLQNQMEHQTKLLEQLNKMSSTMAGLIESQVMAVEKQTEAINRQAFATERHSSVMNNFIDVIREKMFKENSPKGTCTNNSLNEIF